MSEIVERVAKALAGAIHGEAGARAWPWKNYSSLPLDADDVRYMARAAIAAMREPTDLMFSVGRHGPKGDILYDRDCGDAWRDMIDEAMR